MRIILLTPGTGSYHCGVCMRDNALAKALIRLGHTALMLPMYLPLTLDEDAATPGTPIFFGGVSTYLREKFPLLRRMPRWLDRLLSHRALLRLLAGKAAAQTGGPDVAELTLSMLKGEEGNQAGEIDELVTWLRAHGQPEIVWLSTALQAGLAKRIRENLGVPVIGFLQGEDTFLDGLGEPWSTRVWTLLSERMRDVDLWIAPSRYFADLMAKRLGWSSEESARRIQVVPNGISLEGYGASIAPGQTAPPVIGYLARFIPGKGLGLLVDAFITLKKRGTIPNLKLRCAGSMTSGDAIYVEKLKTRLKDARVGGDAEFIPNVSREDKIAFFESLTVFSVPAIYSEAFGLYVIEALAAGVPVVLPNASAFPEIIEATQGGRLFDLGANDHTSAAALADALEAMLSDLDTSRAFGNRGRTAVRTSYTIEKLAEKLVTIAKDLIEGDARAPRSQLALGNALAERSFTSQAGVSAGPLPQSAIRDPQSAIPKTRGGN